MVPFTNRNSIMNFNNCSLDLNSICGIHANECIFKFGPLIYSNAVEKCGVDRRPFLNEEIPNGFGFHPSY